MNDFNYDNEIIEISSDDTGNTLKIEEAVEQVKNKKRKKSLKDKWNDLSKGTKIGIIIITILVILLLIGLLLYFLVFKDNEGNKEPVEESIILEKDNYRYENGKLVFLDKDEKEIGIYECVNKDTEKCYVAKLDFSSDKFDRVKSVNEAGEEIIKNSQIYLNNYVFVYDEEKINLYNISTKATELEFKTIKSYDTEKNLVVVENSDSEFGLLEITEDGYQYLIRPLYDNLGIVNTDLVYLVAQDKDEHYIVNSEGKILSKNIKANIMSVNEEFIVATKNDTYNLYSYEYDELLTDYNYISIHDGVIALVKGNRLYLKNSNLDKLYEDGVRLENSDYVKKYVYDKNNKLIETRKSYEIEIKENSAIITIGDNTKEVNVLEGLISSNLSYISYFDGKLYFYNDEEKEDVIGTYTCTNLNNIVSEEDILNKCHLYTNDNGTSGIYNNEYVIIYDNANKDNIEYYLYSLKENKNKGTYSSIEIVNLKELNADIKQIYTSASFIIAKSATGNNKGNYGVIEINSEKVAGKVGFKYKSIEKADDYYLLVNVDNSYSIYDIKFNKVSNEFDYIEMFAKYYVGIINSKLNIYNYDDKLGILDTDLDVTSNEFGIDFGDGFIISTGDKTYKYDKTGKEIVESEPEIDVPSDSETPSNTTEAGNENEE